MKASGSLPSFQDFLAPIKSRKNVGFQNDLHKVKICHGIAMTGKQEKSSHKWSCKLTKILTFIGALALLIFIVWDYWFRYGWNTEAFTSNVKPKDEKGEPFLDNLTITFKRREDIFSDELEILGLRGLFGREILYRPETKTAYIDRFKQKVIQFLYVNQSIHHP